MNLSTFSGLHVLGVEVRKKRLLILLPLGLSPLFVCLFVEECFSGGSKLFVMGDLSQPRRTQSEDLCKSYMMGFEVLTDANMRLCSWL